MVYGLLPFSARQIEHRTEAHAWSRTVAVYHCDTWHTVCLSCSYTKPRAMSKTVAVFCVRWNAVCVFDDVIEHCGEGAHKYLPACFPAFMEGMTSVSPRQYLVCSSWGTSI